MTTFTRQEALDYHRRGRPGKIQIAPTKPLDSQLHLSLAYSPGVAEAVLEIDKDPLAVFEMTRAPTWSPSSPTAAPSWAWATAGRSPQNR